MYQLVVVARPRPRGELVGIARGGDNRRAEEYQRQHPDRQDHVCSLHRFPSPFASLEKLSLAARWRSRFDPQL